MRNLPTIPFERGSLFNDPRLGRSHPEPDKAARLSGSALLGGPQGDVATEKAEHDRMRKLFMPSFSARRMKALRDHVGSLVDERLDHLAKLTPPVDLHAELSFPPPVLVICRLLGVPYEDREYFGGVSSRMGDMLDMERSQAAREELSAYMGYMAGLIERKRREPGEDVLSDLANEMAPMQKRPCGSCGRRSRCPRGRRGRLRPASGDLVIRPCNARR
ncbi:hypothetical protein [Nonomuraea sp. B19D2]|uniref:hypothetical protein n=1 Tax=Nonomuraea sp. B19D2 TaxID=3159561 RepID=UPI0032DA5AE5